MSVVWKTSFESLSSKGNTIKRIQGTQKTSSGGPGPTNDDVDDMPITKLFFPSIFLFFCSNAGLFSLFKTKKNFKKLNMANSLPFLFLNQKIPASFYIGNSLPFFNQQNATAKKQQQKQSTICHIEYSKILANVS